MLALADSAFFCATSRRTDNATVLGCVGSVVSGVVFIADRVGLKFVVVEVPFNCFVVKGDVLVESAVVSLAVVFLFDVGICCCMAFLSEVMPTTSVSLSGCFC